MSSKKFLPPLPGVVPERDSRVVRCYAEHLEGLGVSVWMTEPLVRTASHVTVWLALLDEDVGNPGTWHAHSRRLPMTGVPKRVN